MQTIQEKFEMAKNRYFEIKKLHESHISYWEWTTHNYYELEPYWHERVGLPKGRKLKKEPKTKNKRNQYGFDEMGRVCVVRTWIDLYGNEACYEEFYVYSERLLEKFYFDYSADKSLIRISELKLEENGRILSRESYNTIGDYIEETFVYQGDQLVEIKRRQPEYGNRQSFVLIKELFLHDEDGELNTIKLIASDSERVLYQKKTKDRTMTDTIEYVQDKLIELIPKVVTNQSLNGTIYSVIIVYSFGASDYFPPSLAIGTEENKTSLMKQYGIEGIWNPSEYKYMLDLDPEIDKELKEQINTLNTFFNQKDNTKQLEKIYNQVAKELNNVNWDNTIRVTDDFVVFALEINESDKFKKNLKSAISKEKFDKLKAKQYI